MLAKLSSTLSLVAAGLAFTWSIALAPESRTVGLRTGTATAPLTASHTGASAPASITVRTVTPQPLPVSPPSGIARHAAPPLFAAVVAERSRRLAETDRTSLDSLVTSLAASPKPPQEAPAAKPAAAVPAPALAAAAPRPAPDDRGATTVIAPMPRLVRRSDVAHLLLVPLHKAQTSLLPIASAPFPYAGRVPGSDAVFLNASVDGRPAHRTGSGRLYLADETYGDNRSLLHLPRGFDINAPGAIVLYFHGHGATLERDVWRRQQLPHQITMSGKNVVLVAPQFAVDARDSSIGRFWQPGALRRYLDETARELARLYGDPKSEAAFARLPVVIVGYSGGYLAAAWGLANGGIRDRVLGVVLLDALYSHTSTFQKFVTQQRNAFFVSAYGQSTRPENSDLKSRLEAAGLEPASAIPQVLGKGALAVIDAPTRHRDYVTRAWAHYPVTDVLRRIPSLSRIPTSDKYASR